jgi:hypothetical protein
MSESPNSTDPSDPKVTPRMLVDYMRGRASPEAAKRVQDALADPQSEPYAWLKGFESWAAKSIPSAKPYLSWPLPDEPEQASTPRPRHHRRAAPGKDAHGLYDKVLSFIAQVRASDQITQGEAEDIMKANADAAILKLTGESRYRQAASKMLDRLLELHPELKSELSSLTRQPRSDEDRPR